MNCDFQTGLSARRLSVLHIMLSAGETSAPYNEHCLPMADTRNISICTYFKPTIAVHPRITLYPGDNSLFGFLRALCLALWSESFDVIHAHSPHVALLYLLVTPVWPRWRAIPSIITVHDSYENYRLRNRFLLLPVVAGFSRIVCCSHSSFNSFPFLFRFLAGRRMTAVENGLDIERVDRISVTERENHGSSVFKIVCICRLVPIKNVLTTLKALKNENGPTLHLTIIGDGPMRPFLSSFCKLLGIDDQVEFTGLLRRDEVYEHLRSADLFISTSRGEGLPVAVLEAMANRCPVLLSDIPPHREIAGGADFISLIEPSDHNGFAREIMRLRKMSPADRAQLGANCRRVVEQRFSLETMQAGYNAIYAEAVKQRKHPIAPVHQVTHAR